MTDMMPYVEKYYRTIPDRQHRAIAGLSMGGSQTLDIAFRYLEKFAYIGVFSSGRAWRRPPRRYGSGRGARDCARPSCRVAPERL